jgi:hypothetical protein
MLGYLNRLKKRMEARRFPSDDRQFQTVLRAYDAIHELNVHVHYLSCESGVGRVLPPKGPHRNSDNTYSAKLYLGLRTTGR